MSDKRLQSLYLALALSLAGGISRGYAAPLSAPGQRDCVATLGPSETLLDPIAIEDAMREDIPKIDEFQFLREMGATHKYRVWLFGGTAASWANFERQKLLGRGSELGAPGNRLGRFSIVNFLRATQDFDIIIDGNLEQASELERKLNERFNYIRGKKPIWEVRLLQDDIMGKAALLGEDGQPNLEFISAHNDSQSTGLVEITSQHPDSHISRDIRNWSRNWSSEIPLFLDETARGQIHYLFSGNHEKTQRAAAKKNPPLLSVIRYLSKVFQYALEVDSTSLAQIRRIIRETDPERDLAHDYVKKWIKWSSIKMVQSATDLEAANRLLTDLGLKSLLTRIGTPEKSESFAWWVNREPLRSRPVKSAAVEWTARSLGITRVVRSITPDRYFEYELLFWGNPGSLNVFADVGSKGYKAWIAGNEPASTNLQIPVTIEIDPDAEEGSDFEDLGHGQILILNKNAARVVPESLRWDPVAYLKWRSDPKSESTLAAPGALERIKLHVLAEAEHLTISEVQSLRALLHQELGRRAKPGKKGESKDPFFWEMIQLLGSRLETSEIRALMSAPIVTDKILYYLARFTLSDPKWAHDSEGAELVDLLISNDDFSRGASLRRTAKNILVQPDWASHPRGWELLLKLADRLNERANKEILDVILTQVCWTQGRDLRPLLEILKETDSRKVRHRSKALLSELAE